MGGLLLPDQAFLPVIPAVLHRLGEVLPGAFPPLLKRQGQDFLVVRCELQHIVEGFLGVLVVKQMYPHQVKGVQELAVGGVGGVVAVHEPVIIDHHAGDAVGWNIAPAVLIVRFLINIGEKCPHTLLRGKRPAESPDSAVLGKRVLLLLALAFYIRLFRGRCGQAGAVLPIWMSGQICVRVEPVPVIAAADVFAIGGNGRPVHELVDFKGTRVDHLHANLIREVPGDGIVFLRSHVPGQRNQNPCPRRVRQVRVCGVHDGEVTPQELVFFKERRVQLVAVQRDHGSAHHIGFLPPEAFQRSGEEPAPVLDGVLFTLLHLVVLSRSLRRPYRRFQLTPQFFNVHPDGMPGGRLAAAAETERQFSHLYLLLIKGVCPCSNRACRALRYARSVAASFLSPVYPLSNTGGLSGDKSQSGGAAREQLSTVLQTFMDLFSFHKV